MTTKASSLAGEEEDEDEEDEVDFRLLSQAISSIGRLSASSSFATGILVLGVKSLLCLFLLRLHSRNREEGKCERKREKKCESHATNLRGLHYG